MSNLINLEINFSSMEESIAIIGTHDKNLKLLETYFDTKIITRGDSIYVTPDINEPKRNQLIQVINTLKQILKYENNINERDILYCFKMLESNKLDELIGIYSNKVLIGKTFLGKPINAKTFNQKNYVKAIENSDLVFGVGPAGTGKTYLAVVKGVALLKQQDVKRIILTRPAVEAGESLGFLPGDLKEKVDPYLRPLYDALHDTLGLENTESLIEKGTIEIAPLAYMRGRTLDDAFVILDEAQNTTDQQMKMFLTRLGFNSKMVVTGDISQVDLPRGIRSGLVTVLNILENIPNVEICKFDVSDVIRHPLVQKVIERYEKYEEKRNV
ncbi:MAG: phosphate starvation-inducible protein PhoH [Haloplasmataceae bacterium]|jgi:phosphate starvation-inducible PhoH-like protein|nr:phosphate starvation-inducible protein PhoH [Haloplasmataceae bacterium]